MTARLLLVDALVILATAGLTLAAAGLLRFPAITARLHATSLATPFTLLILIAAALAGGPAFTLRAILVLAFLLLTLPVGSHAVAWLAARQPPAREPRDSENG